jgi:predicted branched-subunit amino acid permease
MSSGDSGWRAGLRVGAGLGASTLALAISYGALARAAGWNPLQAGVFSMTAFSGSAQFAVLTTLAGGGGILAAIGAATLMNLRYLPMGVAVANSLKGGVIRRGVEGQAVVDGSWVSSYLGNGRFDRGKLLAATAVQWPAWICGTVIGATLNPSTEFIDRWGLDVIFPVFFLLLLVDAFRAGGRAALVAVLAAVLGAVIVLFASPGLALLASAAASLIVLVLPIRRPRTPDPEKAAAS